MDSSQLELYAPSGLILSPAGCKDLQKSSNSWYDEEVTRQGTDALNRRLGALGVSGEKSVMSLLDMTRAQVQTLIGKKGRPTRENLEAALRRTGTSLAKAIDESRKREFMIKKAGERFRAARTERNEPQAANRMPAVDCDRIVRARGLPQFQSFFDIDAWAKLIHEFRSQHNLSLHHSITAADWAFARMHLDGFRVQMLTAIYEFGDVNNVDLHEPPESPKAKVAVILQLYTAFKDAPNRVEVARRAGIKKSECYKVINELIEYCGLEPGDFEPTVSPLPLLLLKSEETSGYVSDCLGKLASSRGGAEDVA